MSAEEIKKKIESLQRKCRFERTTIKQIEKYDVTDMSSHGITVALESLEKCYTTFRDTDEKLCDLDDTLSRMEEINNIYIKTKSSLLEELHNKSSIPDTSSVQQSQFDATLIAFSEHQRELIQVIREQSTSSTPARDQIKLPPIEIPLFYGKNAEEFQSFKDLFISIVHNNASLSNSQKLSYLKRFLKGDAYTLIRHIMITDSNYEDAWNKVVKRYDNPGQIITSFAKKFIEQPHVLQNSTLSLRRLCDVSMEVVSGLKALGPDAETRDVWLNYLIITKLDPDSRNEWAKKTVHIQYPTLQLLLEFLDQRCTALENCDANQKRQCSYKPTQNLKTLHAVTSSSSSSQSFDTNKSTAPLPSQLICRKCEGNHRLSNCDEYNALNVYKRKEFVAAAYVCFNCLGSGHSSRTCASRRRCFVCKRKHHTSIHSSDDQNVNLYTSQSDSAEDESGTTSSQIQTNISLFSSPLLPTVRANVLNSKGIAVPCRILLDSGSNGSLISESCVRRLNLKRTNARYPVKGIASKTITKGSTSITITPHFQSDVKINMDVFIMDHLASNLPQADPNLLNEWKTLKSLPLADPFEPENRDIDVVMGVGYFLRILREGQHEGPNELVSQNTTFGWIIGGGNTFVSGQNSFNVQVDFNIDANLRKFWEMEELPLPASSDLSDNKCEQIFTNTLRRTEDGRFMVKLPFAENAPALGNSLVQATSRFLSLERKLQRNPNLKEQYSKFITEYIALNHMEELNSDDHQLPISQHCYLPHHAVIRDSSLTTKVRVVFDGSAKSSTSTSLNDTLLVGPTVQSDLISILMRFRSHPIAFTSDVEKMYRQVRVYPEDANFQRIIWRDDPQQQLKHYKLTTVTYGTSSAPFLATRCPSSK